MTTTRDNEHGPLPTEAELTPVDVPEGSEGGLAVSVVLC